MNTNGSSWITASAPREHGDPEPPSRVRPHSGRLEPASAEQRALWLFHRVNPREVAYVVVEAIVLVGELDRDLLRLALNEVVRRHESLRTTLVEADGEVMQLIRPGHDADLAELDLRPTSAAGTRGSQETVGGLAAARATIDRLTRQSFDIGVGPLFRPTLLRMDDTEHVLVFAMHHAISDGSSMILLMREIAACYSALVRGDAARAARDTAQYAEHARWQRDHQREASIQAHLAFWQEALAGAPAVTAFPPDRPRRAAALAQRRYETLELSEEVSVGLRKFARATGTTVFTVLLCGLKSLLLRHTGQTDSVVGVTVAGRGRPRMDEVIGLFANSLPIRTRLPPDPTFYEALDFTRWSTRAAYEHQDIPFQMLVDSLRPTRDPVRHPYFQVLLNAPPQARGVAALEFAGLDAVALELPFQADPTLDLTLYWARAREPFAFQLTYGEEIFERSTVRRLLEHYEQLLIAASARPERRLSELLPVTAMRGNGGPAVRTRPIESPPHFAPFVSGEVDEPIFDRFLAVAAAHSQRIAVDTPSQTWTYGILSAQARRVASALRACLTPGAQRVGLLVAHDAPMLAGVLGALGAGKTYVPIDPSWPDRRSREVLEDCTAEVILTDVDHRAAAERLAGGGCAVIVVDALDGDDDGCPARAASPEAIAYILYTSGSTGRPKGVAQTHRGVLGHIGAYTNAARIDFREQVSLVSSYTTDAAVMDMFGALLNGASLHLFDVRALGFDRLGSWVRDRSITLYHSTPTLFRLLAEGAGVQTEFPSVRLVVLGGDEALSGDLELFSRCFAPGCRLINGLGPTECTLALQYVAGGVSEVPGETLPVGYAVEGTEVLLHPEDGTPLEVVAQGEIVIRSPHLALGYWRRPALTAAAFVPDPAGSGRRLFRTGDVGRRLPDGRIAFCGRIDRRLKVRGHLVEPADVEAVLTELPEIHQAAVVPWPHESGEMRLAAFVVAASPHRPSPAELRRALRSRLPQYMLPDAFVQMPSFPLTGSGKVDRSALPPPDLGRRFQGPPFAAPRTPVEAALASIWCDSLGLERVGVDDDFFDLGGHSLHAMRVAARVRQQFGVDLSLRSLFECRTIEDMSSRIIARHAWGVDPSALDAVITELEQLPDDEIARLLANPDKPE